jgi:GNAT superfamily N-acetyltransferase
MILAEEIDALGNKIIVKHSKLDFSPAYSFFLKQQAELVDSGQCFPVTYWDDSTSEIIWVEFDNKIIGSSCFTTKMINHPTFPSIYTHSTFVDKQFRRLGIQTILFKHFENLAIKYNCRAISQTIGINNTPRLAGTKANGLSPLTYIFIKTINANTTIDSQIKIDYDPVGKPIFEYFRREKEKLKKRLVSIGYSEAIAYALTMFEDMNVGIMWVENTDGIAEFVSFDKNEIIKGNLSVYTASSYTTIDSLANYTNCVRIVSKQSIKDTEITQQLIDCGFKNTYVVLYKQINKKD